MKRPSLNGVIGDHNRLNQEELDHWVYEACTRFDIFPPREGVSENVEFLSRLFDIAEINLRHAGMLGWTAHWVQSNLVRTPDYCADTFMGAWCQAFAAKYCSEESELAKRVKAESPIPKRERTKVVTSSSRRSLFD